MRFSQREEKDREANRLRQERFKASKKESNQKELRHVFFDESKLDEEELKKAVKELIKQMQGG